MTTGMNLYQPLIAMVMRHLFALKRATFAAITARIAREDNGLTKHGRFLTQMRKVIKADEAEQTPLSLQRQMPRSRKSRWSLS